MMNILVELFLWNIILCPFMAVKSLNLNPRVFPKHYNLEIRTNFRRMTFTGSVTIDVEINRPDIYSITLHLKDITIKEEHVILSNGSYTLKPFYHFYDIQNDTYTMKWKKPLAIFIFQLYIPFSGIVINDSFGYFQTGYLEAGMEQSIYLTNFEPVYARRLFPCFDEPQYKATFTIRLWHTNNQAILSNIPARITDSNSFEKWKLTTFNITQPKPTYLLSFIIGNLTKFECTNFKNIYLNVWSPTDSEKQIKLVCFLTKEALDFFENKYHLHYPNVKLDSVIVPNLDFDGLSSDGLIIYRELDISQGEKDLNVKALIFSKIALQWFGNEMTINDWSQYWLKEALATYMSYQLKKSGIEFGFLFREVFFQQSIMELDCYQLSDISLTEMLPLQYASKLVSLKGAFILNYIHRQSNYSWFEKIRDLLPKQIMNLELFVENQEKHFVKSVYDFVKHPGFPSLYIERNDDKIFIRQKRFVKTNKNANNNYCWSLQMRVIASIENVNNYMSDIHWFDCPKYPSIEMLKLPSSFYWFVLSVEKTELCKVNYDIETWNNLLYYFENSEIPYHLSSRLVSDAFDFAQIGELDYAIPFRFLSSLKNNAGSIALSIKSHFEFLIDMFRNDQNDLINKFMRKIIKSICDMSLKISQNIYDRAGLVEDFISEMRFKYRVEKQCKKNGKETNLTRTYSNFTKFNLKANTNHPIALWKLMYCDELKLGDVKLWMSLWNQVKKMKSNIEKLVIIESLACTTNRQLFNKYLEETIINQSRTIPYQYVMAMFLGILKNNVWFNNFFEFVMKKYEVIAKINHIGLKQWSALFIEMAKKIRDYFKANEMLNFFNKYQKKFIPIKATIQLAQEIINMNLDWQINKYNAVKALIENFLSLNNSAPRPPPQNVTIIQTEKLTSVASNPGILTMREKKSGALSRVQKLKKRLSHSFGRLSISKEEVEDPPRGKLPYNGYSDEFLDRLEPNGNIPSGKNDLRYDFSTHDRVQRQLSVSSDSKLLDEDIREEARVILRPPKPPRPKSEVFLHQADSHNRRTKRFSAFGGDSPFGKSEAYIKLEQLGEGSYATVFKGYSNLTNQVVALKEIRLQEEEGAPFTAIREASLLKELKHANIVTLHDIVHTRETLTFVFEYVHTDLSQFMERHSGGLNTTNVRLFLFQLLRGLSYCHKRRVLHRDVKPQNLLISEIGELKLADFGLARAKSVPSHTYSHEVVTLWYRPPDVLLGSTEYSTSLDMWGVGCIFIEMITGVPTFPGVRDTYDQLHKIFQILGTPGEDEWPGVTQLPGYKRHRLGNFKPRPFKICWPRLHHIPQSASMATALLQLDPDKRIGAEAALQHAYFSRLPKKLFTLPDDVSIFSVEGVRFHQELPGMRYTVTIK